MSLATEEALTGPWYNPYYISVMVHESDATLVKECFLEERSIHVHLFCLFPVQKEICSLRSPQFGQFQVSRVSGRRHVPIVAEH